jgi:hypothetical protein
VGTYAAKAFECDGTFKGIRFATPRKDGSTVKKLLGYALTYALTFAFAAGMCVAVAGCPKDTAKSTGGGGTGGTGGAATTTTKN